MKPFAIAKGSQFLPKLLIALDNKEWGSSSSQLTDFGGKISTKRTAQQAETALFWTQSAFSLSALGPPACDRKADGCRSARASWRSSRLALNDAIIERYLREWLSHQAASNYLSYDPTTAKFAMPPEQAMVFANEDSPVYMMGGFDVMAAMLDNQPKVQAAFKSGAGVAWGDQAGCMFCAVARFFRPGYHNNLVSAWLPALEGVVKKLEAGARVADVGCGHGWSTVLMAKAFPKSQFIGYDFHPELDPQRHGARREPWCRRKREVRCGPGQRLCRQRLRSRNLFRLSARYGRSCRRGRTHPPIPEIRWDLTIVEPMAGDTLQQNLNPVGRLYYAGSTMICVPMSRSQEVGRLSEHRRVKRNFARSSKTAASPVCAELRRHPST